MSDIEKIVDQTIRYYLRNCFDDPFVVYLANYRFTYLCTYLHTHVCELFACLTNQ